MQGITNVLNGITIQWGDQISHQHSRRSCGRIRFDDQNQKTVFGSRRKLRAQSLWNGNGLHRDTEKRPGYMAAFKDCLNNPIYGLRRYSDDGIARQGRAIDTENAMMFVHQRTAGLAHVKSNIRPNEAINLSPAPGSPGAAETRDDS